MMYCETGIAIRRAITTGLKKLVPRIRRIFGTEAPSTLRIPISLVRCSAVNVANPNKPKQEIKIAIMAKQLASLLISCSLLYNIAYCSSAN